MFTNGVFPQDMHTKEHTFTLKGYLQNSEIRNRLQKISLVRELGDKVSLDSHLLDDMK